MALICDDCGQELEEGEPAALIGETETLCSWCNSEWVVDPADSDGRYED